ncbi:MAG: sigma-70 family RNA polymerase sigma factor [Candidatus Eremiobacteraeota bacterium]|nr:sigma-70 family RNA polymerase sigma factor [Candidatus Eremiobacteraeota bacterium]
MSQPVVTRTPERNSSDWEPFVARIARQVLRRLHLHASALPDLVQDGMVGLLQAERRFDPHRGSSFEAYAAPRVRGAMFNGQSALRWVSRQCLKRVRLLNQAEEKLRSRYQRTPSHAELCVELDISLAELDVRLHERELARSRNHPITEANGPCGPTPEDWIERQPLAEALACLPERQQHLLHLYYQVGLDMGAIARVLQLSQPRVSQLHHASLVAIHKFFERNGQSLLL